MPNPIYSNSISTGSGAGLNVFISETQPEKQNGLWVKRAKNEVNKVLIKSDYYLADGEASKGNGTFTNSDVYHIGRVMQNCIAVGKIIYTFGGNYYNVYGSGAAFAYDTENDVFTNLPSYTISAIGSSTNPPYIARSRECFYMNGVISFLASVSTSNTAVLTKYDIETQTYTYKQFGSGPWSTNTLISGTKQVGNSAYVIAGTSSSNVTIKGILSLYDIETEIFTQLATVTSTTGIDSGIAHLLALYDNKLYIFYGNTFVGIWDLSTFVYTRKGTLVSESYASNAGVAGDVQLLNKVYLIGGSVTNSEEAATVFVYDLISENTTVLSNILPYRLYAKQTATAIVNGTAYVIGGTSISDTNTRLNTVIKFAIQTNEFANGTVVCQPSATTNLTEMYSDKLTTLDFGIDEVYYQSADGFAKQPAAIIKNGIVTDIGGG